MIFSAISLLAALPAAVKASCGYRTSLVPTLALPNFDYTGTPTGLLNWHNIQSSYYACGNGTHQAPTIIDSASTLWVPSSALQLSIPASKVVFENLGTTVEVPMNGTLTTPNGTYALKQFHFHTPAEHRIDGYQYAIEHHFVFQTPTNATAVLAFFFELEPEASTPVLDILAAAAPAIPTPGDETDIDSLDFTDFINQFFTPSNFWYLSQSLTTPPCTEGVQWWIATQPFPLSVSSWKALHAVLKYNARYTQNTLGQTNILQIAAQGL